MPIRNKTIPGKWKIITFLCNKQIIAEYEQSWLLNSKNSCLDKRVDGGDLSQVNIVMN